MSLVAAGDELGRAFPLRLMAECLGVSASSSDPARVELARLLLAQAGGPAAFDPVAAAGERMLELVDRRCGEGAVVLVLEDLHWADGASQALWNRLAWSVDQIPLLVVGSCRPLPQSRAVHRLRLTVQDRNGVVIDLGPLTQSESVGLAEAVLGSAVGPRLTVELGRAGGNPLYVRELVEALARDGSIDVRGGVAELSADTGATPVSLVTAIGRRLMFLSRPTQAALRVAALLGAEFDAGEWLELAGQNSTGLAEVVDEALAGGVLVSSGRGLRFRHDLIRQVLIEQTPASVRDRLHRHLARVLADAGQGIDRVSRHLLAVSTFDGWAVQWLAGAPDGMIQAAPQATAQLLDRVLTQVSHDHPSWELLAARHVQVHFWLGRDDRALTAAKILLARSADAELAGRTRVTAIRAAGRLTRYDRALALANLAGRDPALAPHWQARVAAWAANALFHLGNTAEASAAAVHALAQARACADPIGVGYACMLLDKIDPASNRDQFAAAINALGTDAESADLRMLLSGKYLESVSRSAEWEVFDQAAADALVRAERHGTVRAAWIHMIIAWVCYKTGRWDEALHYVSTISRAYLDPYYSVDDHELVAMIALRRGNGALADVQLRLNHVVDRRFKPRVPPARAAEVYAALALRAETAGDARQAARLWAAWLELPPPLHIQLCGIMPAHVVRAALEIDDIALAQTATALCIPTATQPQVEQILVQRLCQAMIEDVPPDLLAVADSAHRHRWLLLQAFAMEEAAVRLAGQHDVEQAKQAYTRAVRLYNEFGAVNDIHRADGRLRAYGIRRGPRSLHRRAVHGWEALTPTEQRIAALVAKGLSNPDIATQLFLARTTVQTHVSAILSKLSLHSRVEIVRKYTSTTNLHS
jgi:DNA-binding CsgD family transcriptional regulator